MGTGVEPGRLMAGFARANAGFRPRMRADKV